MIEYYLTAKYKDGARGENGFYDCWGLAREARVTLYNRELLDSHGGEYQHDPAGFTREYKDQASTMVELAAPVAGAIIAVLRKKYICTHVALVIHDVNQTGLGLHVLEINPGQGVRIWPLRDFLKAHSLRTIKFYDDKSLS